MQSEIGAGDKVITIGGLHGTVVTRADDKTITIEVAPGVDAHLRASGHRPHRAAGRGRRG